MRGLNNEQLAVMRECGYGPVTGWRRRATKREAVVLDRLLRRGLVCDVWCDAGRIARLTTIGKLLYEAVTSQRNVKGFGL